MPRLIEVDDGAPIALDELVELLDRECFDPADEESFAAMGPLLHRLARNPHFLTDIAIAELKDRCRNQMAVNRYSAQVLMIHQPRTNYFIRANFWPSEEDSIFRSSGTAPFFYGVPHDHNFSFLTVGYLGPGYWSDYYEYDHGAVTGFTGEAVDLRFVERSRLERGKTMLYRAHRDVHLQLPPDSMSVSVNIMQSAPLQPWLNQYRFDLERREIAGIISTTPTEALLALAVHFGDGEGQDVAAHFAARHPSDRVRFSAWKALASAEPDRAARLRRYECGAAIANRFVSGQCRHALREMERGQAWFDAMPTDSTP